MANVPVRDIAAKIKLPEETMQAAINRARNWTKEGLLPTVGEKHPGIGRERLYPKHAVRDAVILQTLVSAVGMSGVGAAPVLKAMLKDAKDLLAEQPREDTVLIASREIGKKEWLAGTVQLSKVQRWIATRPEYVHVVLNAATIYAQTEGEDK
jgi:hypothetical protein